MCVMALFRFDVVLEYITYALITQSSITDVFAYFLQVMQFNMCMMLKSYHWTNVA